MSNGCQLRLPSARIQLGRTTSCRSSKSASRSLRPVLGFAPALSLIAIKFYLHKEFSCELNFSQHLGITSRDPTVLTAWPNSVEKQIRNFVSKSPFAPSQAGFSLCLFPLTGPNLHPCSCSPLILPLLFLLTASSQKNPRNSSHRTWVQGLSPFASGLLETQPLIPMVGNPNTRAGCGGGILNVLVLPDSFYRFSQAQRWL